MAQSNPVAYTPAGQQLAPRRPVLPEWRELDVDDAAWIASIEASRREQFAELSDL